MPRHVLAVLRHPDLDGVSVTPIEAQSGHSAPDAAAIMNRVTTTYRVIDVVPLKSQAHGEDILARLAPYAVPGLSLHFRVDPQEVRSLARPTLLHWLLGRRAPRHAPSMKDEDISGLEKRQMAFDLWAYKKIARTRLPFVVLGLLIAPVVAISPWYLFYVGNVEGSGVYWHALTSVAIGLAVFYGVAFAAARPAVEAMRSDLSEQAIISR